MGMPRLIIESPGQVDAEMLEVGDAECVLLGRVPQVERVEKDGAVSGLPMRTHSVASPSVSANHALVWREQERISLRDLGSRNGTWVRLQPGRTLVLSDEADVNLRLASATGSGGKDQLPDPPSYRSESDFPDSIARSVQAWLSRQDIPARVWCAFLEGAKDASLGTTMLRLADGTYLFIQPERTVDSAFTEHVSYIVRYVAAQNALLDAERSTRSEGMILASPAIRLVHRRVAELARQSLPSLILLGPSGTGKERLAHAYHRHLGRSGPLVAVNCATLTRERLVADLFGAERGAFTGAHKTMLGAVERADGGTLFLDEIGELPLEVQPMLLRFLESGEFQRLGAIGEQRTADARVVAATNRDLRRMVREGSFREDLFFRLALEIVDVPPLRERFADVEAYLKSQTLGSVSALDALQAPALELLRRHEWRGNFRELVNLVRRLPRPCETGSLGLEMMSRTLAAGTLSPVRSASIPAGEGDVVHEDWFTWLTASATAFQNGAEHASPAQWGDVTTFIEQYLKPWMLAHLAGVQSARALDDVSVGKLAEQVSADRGTVVKQLRRYFDLMKDA
jgi:DNA-binding NtrC family response regulator